MSREEVDAFVDMLKQRGNPDDYICEITKAPIELLEEQQRILDELEAKRAKHLVANAVEAKAEAPLTAGSWEDVFEPDAVGEDSYPAGEIEQEP